MITMEVTTRKRLITVLIAEPLPKGLPCVNIVPWIMFSWSLLRAGNVPLIQSGLNFESRLKNHTRNHQGVKRPAVVSDYVEVK
jgi:hypothetical protein